MLTAVPPLYDQIKYAHKHRTVAFPTMSARFWDPAQIDLASVMHRSRLVSDAFALLASSKRKEPHAHRRIAMKIDMRSV
jgi:hypothetical protein